MKAETIEAFPSDLFRFPIGTEFRPVGKGTPLHRVTGHRLTLAETGEVVRTYYRCSHEFCGQLVESDENETTIARRGVPMNPGPIIGYNIPPAGFFRCRCGCGKEVYRVSSFGAVTGWCAPSGSVQAFDRVRTGPAHALEVLDLLQGAAGLPGSSTAVKDACTGTQDKLSFTRCK
jgi:hypothetical protein